MKLTRAERQVFDEALRLGEDLAEELESKTTAYGRWRLDAVLDNAAAEAIDDESKSPIWLELVRRAGGPTPRPSRRMVYVALQLCASREGASE